MNIIDAVSENNYTVVKKRLLLGDDPNMSVDYAGVTPLHIATLNNSISIVRLLLFWNASPNREEKLMFNESPQDIAINMGYREIYKLFTDTKEK